VRRAGVTFGAGSSAGLLEISDYARPGPFCDRRQPAVLERGRLRWCFSGLEPPRPPYGTAIGQATNSPGARRLWGMGLEGRRQPTGNQQPKRAWSQHKAFTSEQSASELGSTD